MAARNSHNKSFTQSFGHPGDTDKNRQHNTFKNKEGKGVSVSEKAHKYTNYTYKIKLLLMKRYQIIKN